MFDEHVQGVGQPLEHARTRNRVIGQREQPCAQCEQMAGEVAAIHRRNVQRGQRHQRFGVVPVVKMSLVLRQLRHRRQRIGAALDQRCAGNVAEVVGGEIGEQCEADIGR